jgi:hypothetical protein
MPQITLQQLNNFLEALADGKTRRHWLRPAKYVICDKTKTGTPRMGEFGWFPRSKTEIKINLQVWLGGDSVAFHGIPLNSRLRDRYLSKEERDELFEEAYDDHFTVRMGTKFTSSLDFPNLCEENLDLVVLPARGVDELLH